MAKEESVSSAEQSKPSEEHTSTSQSARFIAKARELGLDEREEVFDAALKKVAWPKPAAPAEKAGSDKSLQAAYRD